MAVVLPHRRMIAVPMPSREHYELLDNICVTHTLKRPDRDILVLPHNKDSLMLLTNMGINVDGCELFDWYYEPPTANGKSAWWWQLETANFLTKNPYAFVTSTPRTGKTFSTCMAMDCVQKEIGGSALIVAPLTVANKGEWYKTIKEWFPRKRLTLVHKDRINELRQPSDVYLINPDGLKVVAKQLQEMVETGVITIAIFDELTEFGNPTSLRSIAAQNITKQCLYRWGLTGTPGKADKIYGQVKLINPQKLHDMGVTSNHRWKALTEIKIGNSFKTRPTPNCDDIVKEAMTPCIRFDKEQLMSIPIPQVITEEVPLSAEQEKLTQHLVDGLVAMVESNEIEATTASTLAQKMLQVAGGAVRSKDGSVVRVDATPKLNKLVEILHRTPRKKVVFSSFTAINDMLVEHIRSAGFTCEKIDGSVTGGKRSEILHDFLEATDPHVLVCHPRTTAFGVELASADYIICYGTPMTGAFMYQQLFERLSSSRQTADETFVVHLSAGKQDKLSFTALANGVNIERNIVNLFTKDLSVWREK